MGGLQVRQLCVEEVLEGKYENKVKVMGMMEILLDKDTMYAKCKYMEMHLEALNKLKENIFILMFVNIKIMEDDLHLDTFYLLQHCMLEGSSMT